MKFKIVMLICYIGELPWYFEYFLLSCKYNNSVDFVIISNNTYILDYVPKNVKLIYLSLIEINQLATKELGFETSILTGYKLCDFKPAYGLIFKEYTKKYDFWGHGDLDVIFGNIRHFITNSILNNYDIISVRHDFLSGQFLLFRNNSTINSIFKKSKDYIKVLQSDRHFCFDETNFQWNLFTNGIHYSKIDSEIESMTHVVLKEMENGNLNVYFDFIILEGIPGNIKWKNGEIYYKNTYEAMMYHLVLFKKVGSTTKFPAKTPVEFRISTNRIYNFKYS
jgi:hypothetical protein